MLRVRFGSEAAPQTGLATSAVMLVPNGGRRRLRLTARQR
jgi:hypothetical protein